ncbi:MAG TPA: hypothetical protein VH370_10720 [Humisphaera sp.]|jgi:hypothetical protein|nr:hypothetical protein [Humisphaera sp.]
MQKLSPCILPLMLIAFAGCNTCPKSGGYFGPTDSMDRVVADINANNEKIPSLWSSLYYRANIVDEKKQEHSLNGEGVFLYRQPNDLRLIGRMAPVQTIFDIGSNREGYWLRVIPQISTMWYGRYQDLANADLRAQHIPIRPDLVMGVLTVATINTNFSQLPAPTMRFNNEKDAYMFVWITRLPDRWLAYREVWYDRATRRPTLVILYDGDGRAVIRAELGLYKPVPVPNLPKEKWPQVATDYKLTFPDTGSTMQFTLSDDLALSNRGAPNNASFTMPNPQQADVDHAVRIGKSE